LAQNRTNLQHSVSLSRRGGNVIQFGSTHSIARTTITPKHWNAQNAVSQASEMRRQATKAASEVTMLIVEYVCVCTHTHTCAAAAKPNSIITMPMQLHCSSGSDGAVYSRCTLQCHQQYTSKVEP
jgi:hypothetical protein